MVNNIEDDAHCVERDRMMMIKSRDDFFCHASKQNRIDDQKTCRTQQTRRGGESNRVGLAMLS